MRKKKYILFILIAIISLNCQITFAFSKSQMPMYIEIGLFFQETAKSTVLLKSNNGFEIGKFSQNDFIFLMDLPDKNSIILRKDSYYIGSGSNFVEYTGNISGNIFGIHGPYHIQIGNTFNGANEAQQFIQSICLGTLEEKPYLVYENGWKVFIGLYLNQEEAQLKANEIHRILGQSTKIILPSITRVQVLDIRGTPIFMFDSTEDIYFRQLSDKGGISVIDVEGRRYRGAITAKRLSGSDMSIVNKLLLEEYLYGVVPSEMPALWPLEALKAQAVAVRGYAISNLNRFRQLGFDLCNTARSQVYGGFDKEHPNSNRAVDETRSKVLTYNGQLVNAFYHSNSGGHTENSENVWLQPIPYIRGVKDDFSLGHPNSMWTKIYSRDDVKNILSNNNIFIGDVIDIKVTSVSENGRVLELTIYGTKGQEILVKERSRSVLGLMSTWFTVNGISSNTNNNNVNLNSIMIKNTSQSIKHLTLNDKFVISANGISQISNSSNIKIYNGTNYKETMAYLSSYSSETFDFFEFHGRGFGHGLGMSQWGAKTMAEQGYNYIEILNHYYTGTKVE